MHSKLKVWDFIKQNDHTLNVLSNGLFAIHSYDPLLRHTLVNNIFKKYSRDEFKVLNGKDITSAWMDDNLRSLSLFGNTDSYIINNAEELKEDVKEQILSGELMLDERFLVLFFDKSDKFFLSLSKNDDISSCSVVEHAFWESDKLLEFSLSLFGVKVSFESKEYILEVVNNTFADFSSIASQLKLNFNEDSVTIEQLKTIIKKNRIDNFEFARIFGFKKFQDFYKKLLDISPSFDESRSLFYFLQTHMLKVASTDHIYKKNRQTKYDKQIIEQAKIWSPRELELVLKFLKQLEFQSKLKSPFVYSEIKSSMLKSFGV